MRSALVGVILLLSACAGARMPEGEGAGIVTVSPRTVPAGVQTYPRPELKQGDRFVFRVGGAKKLPLRVILADKEKGYQFIDESTGMIETYNPDFGALAVGMHKEPDSVMVFAPVDAGYVWPLWVGKEWTCVYVQKGIKVEPEEILASYRCEGIETVKVPAGEFECVRIWRRSQLTKKEGFFQQAGIFWYSPKLGFWVRSLMGGLERELVEVQRQ